jgi:pyruvate dehydrogenase E2 component (dihydrolipoyllysine-residue acetyltransferase)
MANVTMPQLGETVVEGTILKWLKSEGDRIEQDEPLFEISTDKVDTEVPSPEAGILTKILVPEGQTVSVGTDLAQIDAGDGASSADGAASADGGAEASEKAPASPSVEESPAVEESPVSPVPDARRPPARPDGEPMAPAVPAPAAPFSATAAEGPRSQILSPLVRKLAEEHNVDLSHVPGTGTGGRITKQDVLAYADSGAARSTAAGTGAPAPAATEAATPAAAGTGEEVVPLSHLRKAIGEHMTSSVQTSARAWTMVEANVENVVRIRERSKAAFSEREGFKLTYMPFVTRAVTEALLAFPMVNAELRGEEILLRHYVNMGIAVSIEGGLIVPVIKGADTMNLVGLARAINDVAVRARSKQLQPDEVHGATFSITNPGPFGSIVSVPIINQPNTGILAFDAIEKRPVVIDDSIAIRHMVYLSMSWDHRTIDGALASQFLARVKENLESWDFAEDLGL